MIRGYVAEGSITSAVSIHSFIHLLKKHVEDCYASVIVLGLGTTENTEDGEGIKAMPDAVVLQESLEAGLFNFI